MERLSLLFRCSVSQSVSRVGLLATPWAACARPPVSSPSPGVRSDSYPVSRPCHPLPHPLLSPPPAFILVRFEKIRTCCGKLGHSLVQCQIKRVLQQIWKLPEGVLSVLLPQHIARILLKEIANTSCMLHKVGIFELVILLRNYNRGPRF